MNNNKKAIEILDEIIKGLGVIRVQQSRAINEIANDLKRLVESMTLICADCDVEITPEHYCKATTTSA